MVWTAQLVSIRSKSQIQFYLPLQSKLLITTFNGLPSIKIFGKFSLNPIKTCQTKRFMFLPYVKYYFENSLSVKFIIIIISMAWDRYVFNLLFV